MACLSHDKPRRVATANNGERVLETIDTGLENPGQPVFLEDGCEVTNVVSFATRVLTILADEIHQHPAVMDVEIDLSPAYQPVVCIRAEFPQENIVVYCVPTKDMIYVLDILLGNFSPTGGGNTASPVGGGPGGESRNHNSPFGIAAE